MLTGRPSDRFWSARRNGYGIARFYRAAPAMPQRMRPDELSDPGAAGGPPDDLRGAVPVEAPPVGARKIGP